MKTYFNIVRITTTRDMSVGNRRAEWTRIEEEQLVPGAKLIIYDKEFRVVAIDEHEMEFTFLRVSYKINRQWQVLGTPEISIPNQYISEQVRFVFHFGNNKDNESFDKQYFKTVDKWLYSFAWIIEDPTSNYAITCWDELGRMLKDDPIQATPKWEEVIYEVEKEIEKKLKNFPRGMGFCFSYWSAKKTALARRGIEWKSPALMNPGVMFD